MWSAFLRFAAACRFRLLLAALIALGPALPAAAVTPDAASAPAADVRIAQLMPFTGTPGLPGGGVIPPAAGGLAPQPAPGGPDPGAGGRDPHALLPQPPSGKASIGMSARYGEKGGLIPRGLVWRVFADTPEASGAYPLVGEAVEPAPVFFLSPGGYVVHVSYGLASAARKIVVGGNSRREQFDLPAGAIKLQSDVNDVVIPGPKVSFDLFEGSFLQGKTSSRPYYRGVNSGDIIILPAGSYYVVSTYGDGNAVIQADVSIQPGKLTEAMIHHRAAEVTLRLVQGSQPGAPSETQWSVLTPGGDTIKESVGAQPVFVLAEGDYVGIARHDGKVYTKEFSVETGKDVVIDVAAQ
ncbi:hypothetical protein [Ancylobacter terrae]|uniref:hypothetical protein n=1 Tax=Ancylobacter sp. sgz301288 TaxID=3342077 RepID=UPI0038589EAC